jgi:hypothetical protein
LKQQASTPGGLEQLIGQIAGGTGGSGANALQSLITPQLQQQILQTVGQKTGISPNLLQGLIPTLLPALLGLFNLGASKPGVPGGGVNPLLSSFLSGGTGQSNDLGNALNFANRFLNPS